MKKIIVTILLFAVLVSGAFTLFPTTSIFEAGAVTRGVQIGDALGVVQFEGNPSLLTYPPVNNSTRTMISFSDGSYISTVNYYNPVLGHTYSLAFYYGETLPIILANGLNTYPTIFEISSYDFAGRTISDISNDNITVLQQIFLIDVAVQEYTVTFKDWNNTVISTQQVEEGAAAIVPDDPVRSYYVFTGWDVSFDNVTSDLTVTAQYEIVKHTITFQDWYETVLSAEQYPRYTKYNEVTVPPAPVRLGCIFTGWPTILGSQTGITGDATFTAEYVPGTSSRPALATDKLYNVLFNIELDSNDLFTHIPYDNLYHDVLIFSDNTKIVYREGDSSMATSQLYYYDGSGYITLFTTAEHYYPYWVKRSYDFGGKQIASVPMPQILQLISVPEFTVQFQKP